MRASAAAPRSVISFTGGAAVCVVVGVVTVNVVVGSLTVTESEEVVARSRRAVSEVAGAMGGVEDEPDGSVVDANCATSGRVAVAPRTATSGSSPQAAAITNSAANSAAAGLQRIVSVVPRRGRFHQQR